MAMALVCHASNISPFTMTLSYSCGRYPTSLVRPPIAGIDGVIDVVAMIEVVLVDKTLLAILLIET